MILTGTSSIHTILKMSSTLCSLSIRRQRWLSSLLFLLATAVPFMWSMHKSSQSWDRSPTADAVNSVCFFLRSFFVRARRLKITCTRAELLLATQRFFLQSRTKSGMKRMPLSKLSAILMQRNMQRPLLLFFRKVPLRKILTLFLWAWRRQKPLSCLLTLILLFVYPTLMSLILMPKLRDLIPKPSSMV